MPLIKKIKTSPSSGNITISYSILGIGLLILVVIIGGIAICDGVYKWKILLREYIAIETIKTRQV